MPVFDTPINTDDNRLDRVLTQALPVLLYLYDRDHQQGANSLNQTAGDHAGKLLVVKINVVENPKTAARYNPVTLPAIFAIKGTVVQSSASGAEIEAVLGEHVAYLLGQGSKPATKIATTSVNSPMPVTDSTFQREVLQSEIPVLVDFWAPWCGPCHAIAPAVEQIARQYAGRAKVVKLNVDENPRTASQYQTMSIPTLILFKGGRQVNRLVGTHPPASIENLVRSAL